MLATEQKQHRSCRGRQRFYKINIKQTEKKKGLLESLIMKICPARKAMMNGKYIIKLISWDVIISVTEKFTRYLFYSCGFMMPDICIYKLNLCAHLNYFMVNDSMLKGNRGVLLKFNPFEITCPEKPGNGCAFNRVIIMHRMKYLLIVGDNALNKCIFYN